ncbi:MAG: pentapeptide repeat-containing protein [Planctomycetota bacterium]
MRPNVLHLFGRKRLPGTGRRTCRSHDRVSVPGPRRARLRILGCGVSFRSRPKFRRPRFRRTRFRRTRFRRTRFRRTRLRKTRLRRPTLR